MFRSQQTEMFPKIAPHQAATYPYQATSMPAVTAAETSGINISEIMNMMIMLIVVVMMMKMMTRVSGDVG